MLELLVAALIQISVLTSGSAPAAQTNAAKVSSQPTTTTNIGGTGWDDRN